MLKNALKIPGKDALPEVYLSSDFFKSKVGKVVPRGKDRDLSQGRAKTNFFFPQPRLKDEAEAVSGKDARIQSAYIPRVSRQTRKTPCRTQWSILRTRRPPTRNLPGSTPSPRWPRRA
jgi:hypothetical protein